MGDIVNLRVARKAKAKATNELNAAANRAKFGAPKFETKLTASRREADKKHLDGHKRDRPDIP